MFNTGVCVVYIYCYGHCNIVPAVCLSSLVGQGRTDGAVCEHTEEEKLAYLKGLNEIGISNIEMECTALAALTHHAGVKSAVVCVALLDRLLGDQVTISPEDYKIYQQRPQALVIKFIKSRLGSN